MSHWKLVEAEVEHGADVVRDASQDQSSGERQWGPNSSRNWNRRQNNGGRGGRRNHRPKQEIFVPDTPETRQYLLDMAMQQIEFQYSADNMCRDTYFRSFMDEEGYLPLIYVLSYPHIGSVGADYYSLLEAINKHEVLEANMENETIRLRKGWDAWLIPNPDGTKGCPKYVKEAVEAEEVPEGSDSGNMRARSDSKELSANAPAFVVK